MKNTVHIQRAEGLIREFAGDKFLDEFVSLMLPAPVLANRKQTAIWSAEGEWTDAPSEAGPDGEWVDLPIQDVLH